MRRTTALFATVSSLLAALVLGSPTAGADPQAATGSPAPAGWEVVDGGELAGLTAGADTMAARTTGTTTGAAAEGPLALQSVRNGNFVAAEAGYAAPYTGVLRARSSGVFGGWETLDIQWDEATQSYTLLSLGTGKYVAVEQNYTGDAKNVLRARSISPGSWERFALWYNESLDRWALQSNSNGLFVTMEQNYTGTLQYVLRARSTEISGSWEEFFLYNVV